MIDTNVTRMSESLKNMNSEGDVFFRLPYTWTQASEVGLENNVDDVINDDDDDADDDADEHVKNDDNENDDNTDDDDDDNDINDSSDGQSVTKEHFGDHCGL